MLIVDQVAREYPTPAGPLRILEHVSLAMNAGDEAAIMGQSGSGNSNLL